MKYKSTNSGFGYVVRLEKGEEIIFSLKELAKKENLTGGFFYGLGAVEGVSIGYYELARKEYVFSKIQGAYELASLLGNISVQDGEIKVHAHAVLGDNNLNTVAGHVKEANVAITCEIFIHLQHGAEMRRELDEETGLGLLEFN